jgi:hypothetical protein
VLLMQGRTSEARHEITRAWHEMGRRYDVTSARILTMRLTVALIDDEPNALFVGQLMNHLAMQPLPDYADVDRRWQLRRMLDVLAPRLDPEALTLLQAIGDVVNGHRALQTLEELPRWRDTPPVPLEEQWPSECSPGSGIESEVRIDVTRIITGDRR